MSVAMDRAMMALNLEEDDVPFKMPNLPGISSAEENKLSLMGRLLNPECQKMSTLIYKMPRKWQKEGRIRGIALSEERFQFIFQNEHDLMDVLEKGVQTFNEWVIVMERWVENPPEDYLQYVNLWVQISKIPVNYYTEVALTALGDIVGKTIVVAFDPSKPITQPFVRVQVKFNVANPLRMAKTLDLGEGKSTVIHFDYENVQKRCFTCHRLNHEKSICPVSVKKRQEEARVRRMKIQEELSLKKPYFQEQDPLFGVLAESQVGINPATGRPRIAEEVLQEMRRYLCANTGEDQAIKIDKVIKSVQEAEKDPEVQRTFLRLEAPPEITKDLNRGKGLVFDYGKQIAEQEKQLVVHKTEKLVASAFQAYKARSLPFDGRMCNSEGSVNSKCATLSDLPTVFKSGAWEPASSGMIRKSNNPRRRPSKAVRKQRKDEGAKEEFREMIEHREGKQVSGSKKRKYEEKGEEGRSTPKACCLKAIPHEGLPNVQ
ncbi:uncharacterized protein LOC103828136 [Brassica rapa]|uniref:uncharacterized protein LOC103828136 n=1 Tax=Brassica campestris TaxID=3711 RepID=UPI0004F189C4|nr:uncharacterized protein LOC103828136 [Brassica rapa]XP_013658247.1 uncharacterized protein LOC106362978 [Brassica napus]